MFYKKGCQEKSSPSTGGREDFGLDIQPTVCKCPRFCSRDFALACLSFLWVSSFGGDDANRVLKLGNSGSGHVLPHRPGVAAVFGGAEQRALGSPQHFANGIGGA